MADYTVTLRFQFPAWDEKDGIPFDIAASTKGEAVVKAKRQAERDGHWPSTGKGRATFTAVEASVPFTDVCNETAYGTTQRLSFVVRVF